LGKSIGGVSTKELIGMIGAGDGDLGRGDAHTCRGKGPGFLLVGPLSKALLDPALGLEDPLPAPTKSTSASSTIILYIKYK
jgi:hypothetical protein